jgi:hypothetical protein
LLLLLLLLLLWDPPPALAGALGILLLLLLPVLLLLLLLLPKASAFFCPAPARGLSGTLLPPTSKKRPEALLLLPLRESGRLRGPISMEPDLLLLLPPALSSRGVTAALPQLLSRMLLLLTEPLRLLLCLPPDGTL